MRPTTCTHWATEGGGQPTFPIGKATIKDVGSTLLNKSQRALHTLETGSTTAHYMRIQSLSLIPGTSVNNVFDRIPFVSKSCFWQESKTIFSETNCRQEVQTSANFVLRKAFNMKRSKSRHLLQNFQMFGMARVEQIAWTRLRKDRLLVCSASVV